MNDRHDRRSVLRAISAAGFGVGLAGCTGGNSGAGGASTGGSTGNQVNFNLEEIEPATLVGKGPSGREPSAMDSVSLTEEQEQNVRSEGFNVEVVFQYTEDTWVRLQREAIRERTDQLGINITGIQYSDFDPEKQSNILQTVAQKNDVDGVFSIPVDTAATADAYRAVSESGKELVFMDNVPQGFTHPEDYTGLVAADNRAMGTIGGRMMSELIDPGKVIVIQFDVPFYVVDEREEGFKRAIRDAGDYNLEVFGFTDSGNVLSLAQNALTANPDANALWAPWVDPPAAQAIQAIQEQAMDIPVTSCDLGTRSAVLMAEQTPLQGVGSQQPYQQGLTEVNLMAHALLGNETPPYIAVPSPAVARQNLLDMYPEILQRQPPQEVTQHFQ